MYSKIIVFFYFLFQVVILPLLESKIPKALATHKEEPEPILLWAMKSLVKLQSLNCNILSRLLESRSRYSVLVDSLLSACTSKNSSFQTELGYASYATLGALTMAEVAHFSDADDKVMILNILSVLAFWVEMHLDLFIMCLN